MGEYSVIVTWRTKTGEVKRVQTKASRVGAVESQIRGWGGAITRVERYGGGAVTSTKTATGKTVFTTTPQVLYQAPKAVSDPVGAQAAFEKYSKFYSAVQAAKERSPILSRALSNVPSPTEYSLRLSGITPSDIGKYSSVVVAGKTFYPAKGDTYKAMVEHAEKTQRIRERLAPLLTYQKYLATGKTPYEIPSQVSELGKRATTEYVRSTSLAQFAGIPAERATESFAKKVPYYYSRLPVPEKVEYMKKYFTWEGKTWEQYLETPAMKYQTELTAKSLAEEKLKTPVTYKIGPWEVKEPQWMADLAISTVAVYDYGAAREKMAVTYATGKDVWSTLGSRTKFTAAWAQAGLEAVAWPVTLPQFVVKAATGKTHVLPDISAILGTTRIPSQPAGLIGTAVGEGIGVATGERPKLWEAYTKDPWSGAAATWGELSGLMIGGAAVQVAKAGTVSLAGKVSKGVTGVTGWKLPSYTTVMYYMPQRALRRVIVRKIGKTEIGETAMGSFHTEATLSERGLSMAPGRTPAARISWTVGKTAETMKLPFAEGEYFLGSSGSIPVGMRYTIKATTLHELPAMSLTPYGFAPTRFYRFGPSAAPIYSSSISLIPHRWAPTGLAARVSRIYKPPKGTYEEVSAWGLKQTKGSWAVIGPKMYLGGGETELNIFGGKWFSWGKRTVLKRYLPMKGEATTLQKLFGYQYYAKVPLEGGKLTEVVPVKFVRPLGKGVPTGVKQLLGGAGERVKEAIYGPSEAEATVSALTPSSITALTLRPPVVGSSYAKAKTRGLGFERPTPSTYKPKVSVVRSISLLGSSLKKVTSVSSWVSRPSYSIPSIVSRPSLSKPSYPSKPSVSKPSYPSYPSVSYPSYPSPPSYPTPSSPLPPSRPSPPSYPSISRPPPPSYSLTFFSRAPEKKGFVVFKGAKKLKFEKVIVLSDIFRVQTTQIKYGRATHPKATKEVWSLAERLGWRLPTAEMIRGKKVRRGKRK